jgi:hypothetical protein
MVIVSSSVGAGKSARIVYPVLRKQLDISPTTLTALGCGFIDRRKNSARRDFVSRTAALDCKDFAFGFFWLKANG